MRSAETRGGPHAARMGARRIEAHWGGKWTPERRWEYENALANVPSQDVHDGITWAIATLPAAYPPPVASILSAIRHVQANRPRPKPRPNPPEPDADPALNATWTAAIIAHTRRHGVPATGLLAELADQADQVGATPETIATPDGTLTNLGRELRDRITPHTAGRPAPHPFLAALALTAAAANGAPPPAIPQPPLPDHQPEGGPRFRHTIDHAGVHRVHINQPNHTKTSQQ